MHDTFEFKELKKKEKNDLNEPIGPWYIVFNSNNSPHLVKTWQYAQCSSTTDSSVRDPGVLLCWQRLTLRWAAPTYPVVLLNAWQTLMCIFSGVILQVLQQPSIHYSHSVKTS